MTKEVYTSRYWKEYSLISGHIIGVSQLDYKF